MSAHEGGNQPHRFSRAHGLTLIEVLVVIGVVIVVSAVTFPVIMSAKGSARAASCVQAQRQSWLAVSLYTEDQNGMLPAVVFGQRHKRPVTSTDWNWRTASKDYWGTRIRCPDADRQSVPEDFTLGLGFNAHLSKHSINGSVTEFVPRPLVEIDLQAVTVGVTDCSLACVGVGRPETFPGLWSAHAQDLLSKFPTVKEGASRHHEAANYTFVDGHSKWLKPSAFSAEADLRESDYRF